jgi:aryl-alcohol dehydrogenase-like predicted oxidoreductase
VPAVRIGRHPLEPAGRWVAGGWLPQGSGAANEQAGRPGPVGLRRIAPGEQRKLEAADQLARLADESGMTLVHMALAFVMAHPAVSAAIIGPRTMEHLESQLGATEVHLDGLLLDRIDEIVPPGTTLNPDDSGWQPPALATASLRRRSQA